LTKSVLVNLANAGHYNSNDDGIGIGVWFEKDKFLYRCFCIDVYFVMHNILVENSNGATWNGLVIKLKDRCVISWDGTSICHCTSMRIDSKYLSKNIKNW